MRQGFWMPLVLFGVLVIGSALLYAESVRFPWPSGTVIRHVDPATYSPARAGQAAFVLPDGKRVEAPTCAAVNHVVDLPCAESGARVVPPHFKFYDAETYTAHPTAVSIYWLIGLPIGFLLSGGWYWLRRRRRGIATSAVTFVVLGLIFVLLGVLTSPGMQHTLHVSLARTVLLRGLGEGWSSNRGTGPLTVIGVGLLALSYLERSRTLAVFSIGYLGLAFLANLYDLGNVTARLGWYVGIHETQLAVALAGLYLVVGGAAFGFRQRRSA